MLCVRRVLFFVCSERCHEYSNPILPHLYTTRKTTLNRRRPPIAMQWRVRLLPLL